MTNETQARRRIERTTASGGGQAMAYVEDYKDEETLEQRRGYIKEYEREWMYGLDLDDPKAVAKREREVVEVEAWLHDSHVRGQWKTGSPYYYLRRCFTRYVDIQTSTADFLDLLGSIFKVICMSIAVILLFFGGLAALVLAPYFLSWALDLVSQW